MGGQGGGGRREGPGVDEGKEVGRIADCAGKGGVVGGVEEQLCAAEARSWGTEPCPCRCGALWRPAKRFQFGRLRSGRRG